MTVPLQLIIAGSIWRQRSNSNQLVCVTLVKGFDVTYKIRKGKHTGETRTCTAAGFFTAFKPKDGIPQEFRDSGRVR